MADNKKIYSIQINGIDQSIKQVDALSDALQFLDKKIKELESRSVSITSSNSGGGGNRTAELNTEDKLLKQIQSTEQQIIDARREDYQSLLAQKDLLKDITNEAKQRAAAERLLVGNYGNTMNGLKQELSDIKTVMQATDLGSNKFDELNKRASELTNKIKELDQSYGQFGRNAGNNKSAFDGFDKISVNIGGVVKEFDNLKQAAKAIRDAMGALEYNGNNDTEMYKQLEVELNKVTKAQLRLNSAINDAKSSSQAMDDLMDTLQSFGAMGQVTQGFSALFGIDNDEIERSIQKLVALQNVMQGIEKIRQQMNTQEGIGKMFAKGFDQIDAMNFKLKRAIVSINGTGTAAKAAAIGVNVLTTATKALASIGIVAVISAAAYAIEKLVSWMNDWAKGNAELVSSEKILKVAIDDVNSSLDKNIKLAQAKYNAGRITYQEKLIEEEKAYADALKASNTELKKRIELDSKNPDTKNNTFTQYASGKKNNADIYNDKGVTTFGGFTEAIKTDDELIRRYEALSEAVNKNTGLVYKNAKGYEIAHLSLENSKDELNHLEQMLAGRMVNAMQQFDLSTKEGREGLAKFATQILNSDNKIYKSLFLRLPEIIQENSSGLKAGLSNWLTIIQQFVQNADVEMNKLDAEKWANSIIESADKTGKKMFQRQREQADAMLKNGFITKKKHDEVIAAINKNEKDKMKAFLDGEKRTADERRKKIEDAEANLAKARVDSMKEGLTKTLAQLELERNTRIANVKKNGILVNEQIELINKQYQDKVFEAKVQYHTNLINEEKKYVEKVKNLNYEMYQKEVEISRKRNELRKADKTDNAVDLSNDFQVNTLTIDYNSSDVRKYIDQYGKDVLKAYTNTKNTVEYLEKALGNIGDKYEQLPKEAQKVYDKYSLMLKEAKEQLKNIEDENEGISDVVKNIGIISEKTSEAYVLRTQRRKEYYETLLEISKEAADKELVIEKEKLDTEYEILKENEDERHKLMISRYYDDKGLSQDDKNNYKTPRKAEKKYLEEYDKVSTMNKDQKGTYFSEYRILMDKWIDNIKKGVQEGKYTWEDYNEFMNQEAIKGYLQAKTEYENFLIVYNKMSAKEQAKKEGDLKKLTTNLNNAYVDYLDKVREEQDTHDNKMNVIKNQHDNEIKESEKKNLKERQAAYTEFYSNLLSETENVLSSVNNKIDKAEKINAWGIINYSATKKELKDLDSTITIALNNIASQKEQLLERLKKGEISFGDYDTLISQLKIIETQAQDTAKNVSTKLKDLTGEWWGSIDQWLQQVGQTMSTILSSLSEIQSNKYDKMIDQQEKYIEEYQKMLDKQKEITQEHASAVDSIEDELSTARGDRRQHLIDQLNAEMAAQRASLAQQKKIEKEKEKAEHKKADLEYAQAVARKRMQESQALINAAMAVSMAAVNNWPIPAIPMMSLAAAAGAAQYAAVKSQYIPKPSYGSGGVIQGKSHKEGGVPVLGGRAEVEGGEYITNKVTTAKNVDLLEYINSKKKRINLDDLIEFYGGSSPVKKNIQTIRTKFADGGIIPTLRNDINLSDRMLTAFEDYSNRPVQVAVVDIIDRTQAVNDVRVMAGLD